MMRSEHPAMVLVATVAAICLLCVAQPTFAGFIVGWGYNAYGQATPPAGNDFVAISGGGRHSSALRSDGSLMGWGLNDWGQTNIPAGNDYVAIAGGWYHNLAVKAVWLMDKRHYARLLNTKDVFAVQPKRTKVKFCEGGVLCIEK